MPDETLPHLRLRRGEAVEFRNPQPGRGKRQRVPTRDRQVHAAALLQQLDSVEAFLRQPAPGRAPEARGHLLTAEAEPEADLKPESLRDPRTGIALVAVSEDRAIAHLREDDVSALRSKIEDYASKETKKTGKPRNEPLIAPIRELRPTTLADLTDGWLVEELVDPTQLYAVELWAFGGRLAAESDRQRITRELHWLLTRHGVSPDVLRRFKGTERDIFAVELPGAALIQLPLAAPEVYRVQPMTSVVRDVLVAADAADLLADAAIWPPDPQASVIAILDTGIAEGHPLLSPAMHAPGVSVVVDDPSAADRHGHGTDMAGLAAYNDIADELLTGRVQPRNWLENIRILRNEANTPEDREFWPERTEQGFGAAEANGSGRRVFNMSFGARNPQATARTSWSVGMDVLAHNEGNARLVCVAAGSMNPSATREDYPTSNLATPLDDPAQALNVLTVGATTSKTNLPDDEIHGDLVPLAHNGCLSPYSQCDVGGNRAIKPDVVFEGGNCAPDGQLPHVGILALSSLTTSLRFGTGRPLEQSWGTSAACAGISGLAGVVWSDNRDHNANTVRALVVHSARWTDGLVAQFRDRRDLMRAAGYGVPDADRARASTRSRPTLVLEERLQLPATSSGRPEIHYVPLPLPTEELEALGAHEVELSVCLAFTIEPNDADARVYPGALLRWDLQRPLETREAFRERVNDVERPDDFDDPGGSYPWEIGPQARGRGSVQADRCRVTASELAGDRAVAIWPVLGWWRGRKERRGSEVPYSLVVTIDAGDADVDLYTPIEVALTVPVDAT